MTEGSSGFFGIGKKPAIIKARRKEETLPEEPVAEEIKESVPVKKEVKKTDKAAEKPVEETVKPVKYQETKKEQPKPREEKKIIKRSEEEIAEIKAEAEKFLSGVFKAMELEVELKIEYTAEDGSLDKLCQDIRISVYTCDTYNGFVKNCFNLANISRNINNNLV